MIDTKLLQDLTGQTIDLLRKYKEALDNHEKSQAKPDYTILSFKSKMTDEITKRDALNNDKFSFVNTPFYTTEAMLRFGNPIHSVRRNSDNTVWTVGEKTRIGEIQAFKIIVNEIYADVTVGNKGFTAELGALLKMPQPLFTTDDGVNIFDGDKYWMIEDDGLLYITEGDTERYKSMVRRVSIKRFSTKEAAEKYVWQNKRVFSYTDIKNAMMNMDTLSHYEELAKQRITLK